MTNSENMSFTSRFKNVKNKTVLGFINLILKYPRLAVILPAILLFVLSYTITYDFTIRTFNAYFSNNYASLPTQLVEDYADPKQSIPSLHHKLLQGLVGPSSRTVSKITLFKSDKNILTFEVFKELNKLHNSLKHLNVSVISPFSDYPISQIRFDDSLTPTTFQSFIIKYLNYDLSYLLTTLYIDKLVNSNQLIKYANTINIYLIFEAGFNATETVTSLLADEGSDLRILSVIESNNAAGVTDFIRYYLNQKGLVWSTSAFLKLSTVTVIMLMLAFMVHMYICIANVHRVRSSFGLVFGWFLGVIVSIAAAVNLATIIHNRMSWKTMFEPSTTFSKCAFVLTGLLYSSRFLLVVIRVLNDEDDEAFLSKAKVGGKNFYKNLYKLFTGFYGLPILTRDLIILLAGSIASFLTSKMFIHFFISGNLRDYIIKRMFFLNEALVVTILLQYAVHLTYIVGIVLVDRTIIDITDFLDHSHQRESLDQNADDVKGVNVISAMLLKLSQPSNARPPRDSIRYRIGQRLIKMRYPIEEWWCVTIISSLSFILLLCIFMHWIMVVPCTLVSQKSQLVNFESLMILKNSNNFIYYVELSLILFLMVVISLIVFKITTYEKSIEEFQGIDSKGAKFADFQNISPNDVTTDAKVFNAIEFSSNAGHYLDILSITTNSKCSFIVTIGMDHKVLVWSPLSAKPNIPVNISSTVKTDLGEREFWPINHVNISDDGNFIVLISFRHSLIKCFDRKSLSFIWELELDYTLKEAIRQKRFRILESFFRRRTVPGFLARKILQKQKQQRSASAEGNSRSRRNSVISMNGNFPAPTMQLKNTNDNSSPVNFEPSVKEESQEQLIKDDFVFILESGELISLSCSDGNMKIFNVLEVCEYPKDSRLISVKKISTPRLCDRIVFQTDNHEIIVATVMNNNWKCRKMVVREDSYNQGPLFAPAMMASNSGMDNDFASIYNCKKIANTKPSKLEATRYLDHIEVNKSVIVTIEFVGMIVRVRNFVAELIDIQKGIILRTFNVGHFKASSFRVSHSEPTHCKFCGCASVNSFSIIYEDNYSSTLIIHTFKIENKRSKTNICLRVERDPREIRCLGFNAVTEHQYWFSDVAEWELTDVNMIIGVRKRNVVNDDSSIAITTGISTFLNAGELRSKSSRVSTRYEKMTVGKLWEGFIVTADNGNLTVYGMPQNKFTNNEIVSGYFNCVEKYGYKSIILCTSNLMEILYLGNDNLVEDDIYFSGTNATMRSVLSEGESQEKDLTQPLNSGLMFISKRRKQRERLR